MNGMRSTFSIQHSNIIFIWIFLDCSFTIYNSHLIHMQWLSLFSLLLSQNRKKFTRLCRTESHGKHSFPPPFSHHLIFCVEVCVCVCEWFKFPIHWREIVSFSVCIPRRSVATTKLTNENYYICKFYFSHLVLKCAYFRFCIPKKKEKKRKEKCCTLIRNLK